jgi:hypothetical protein
MSGMSANLFFQVNFLIFKKSKIAGVSQTNKVDDSFLMDPLSRNSLTLDESCTGALLGWGIHLSGRIRVVLSEHIPVTFSALPNSTVDLLPVHTRLILIELPLVIEKTHNVSIAFLLIFNQNLMIILRSRLLSLNFPPAIYNGHLLLNLLLVNEQLISSVAHINASLPMSKRPWVHESA